MARARTSFLLGLLVGAAGAAAVLASLPGTATESWSAEDRAMAARMRAFSSALTKPPANSDPAPGWRPLLRMGEPQEVRCAVCHGDSGVAMERAIAAGDLAVEAQPLELEPPELEHAEMVELMERWMHQLNRHARARLVKAVRCVDCHATDPRD